MICRQGAARTGSKAACSRCCSGPARSASRLASFVPCASSSGAQHCSAASPSASRLEIGASLPSAASATQRDDLAGTIRASMSAALLSVAMLVAPMASPPAHASVAAQDELSRKAVEEYAELEAAGKTKSSKGLEEIRSKYRIRRTMDGRVQVRSTKGDWWSVRLDMEVPGALLLRDPSGGIYAVQTSSLQQVDLSDDYVCLLMFADGAWEEQMSVVDFTDETGKTKQLKLDEKEFREVIGLLKEADGWEDDGKDQ